MSRRLFVTALSLLAMGCSDPFPAPQSVYSARGRISLADGRPARGAAVVLSPDGLSDGFMGTEAVGLLQPDGTFSIKQISGREGATRGRYRVAVVPTHPGVPKQEAVLGRRIIPRKYWAAETTDLTVEIKPSENVLEFTLR